MQIHPEKLTVAIPTWNRPAQLQTTLESICNQPEALHVEFLILDNGSDVDYSSITETLKNFNVPYRYKRNEHNIGMCANILRCIEASEGEWVWILGDDDPVVPDALERVMAAINAANTEDIICFSEAVQLGYAQNNQTLVIDFQAYLLTSRSLEAICGISENVFRRSAFMGCISHGYHYATTLFPHLVVSLAVMSAGGKIRFRQSTLLQKKSIDATDRWYWPSWDLGVGLLLDLPFLKADERKLLKAKLIELSTKKALFIHSVAMLAANFDRPFVIYVYMQSSLRCFGVLSSLLSPYTYAVLGATLVPKLASFLMGLLYRITRKKVSFSYYTNSMKSKRIN